MWEPLSFNLQLICPVEHQREEFEKLTRNIKQLELFKEEIDSKLKITKLSTKKAEEEIIRKEMEKKRQDYMIDNMIDQLRKLQEKKELIEQQINNQQKDTRAIMEMVQDATTEIEVINFEKKQLMHQWKSSLVSLQKKEEGYHEIERSIKWALNWQSDLDSNFC